MTYIEGGVSIKQARNGFILYVGAPEPHIMGETYVFPNRQKLAEWIGNKMPKAEFETADEAAKKIIKDITPSVCVMCNGRGIVDVGDRDSKAALDKLLAANQ